MIKFINNNDDEYEFEDEPDEDFSDDLDVDIDDGYDINEIDDDDLTDLELSCKQMSEAIEIRRELLKELVRLEKIVKVLLIKLTVRQGQPKNN